MEALAPKLRNLPDNQPATIDELVSQYNKQLITFKEVLNRITSAAHSMPMEPLEEEIGNIIPLTDYHDIDRLWATGKLNNQERKALWSRFPSPPAHNEIPQVTPWLLEKNYGE